MLGGYFANWKIFDPRKLIPLSMEDCRAPIAVITEITEKTPMVIPFMVKADCPDEKRKTSYEKARNRNRVFDRIESALQRLLFVDAEVVFFLRRQPPYATHQSGKLVPCFSQFGFVFHFYQDVRFALGAEVLLEYWQRHHDNCIQTEKSEK